MTSSISTNSNSYSSNSSSSNNTMTRTALTLFLLFSQGQAWISAPSTIRSTRTTRTIDTTTSCRTKLSTKSSLTLLYDSLDDDFYLPSDSSSNRNNNNNRNSNMVLSKSDLHRLTQLRSRQLTLPLLLVQDSLLPGQVMELASTDGKFKEMVKQLQQLDSNNNKNDEESLELCVVGMHPYNPGEPLNVGVSVVIEQIINHRHHSILKVRGNQIVDVQGQPRFDSKKSCFLADLEVAQDVDTIILTRKQLQQAANWYDDLVPLTNKWYDAILRHNEKNNNNAAAAAGAGGHHDDEQQHYYLNLEEENVNAVKLATGLTTRAHAVASLLNPSSSQKYNVSMEIRPALLACRNEYDRLHLVHTALQASLQQLELENDSH